MSLSTGFPANLEIGENPEKRVTFSVGEKSGNLENEFD